MRCVGNALPPIIMFQALAGRKPHNHLKRRYVNANPASPCFNRNIHRIGIAPLARTDKAESLLVGGGADEVVEDVTKSPQLA